MSLGRVVIREMADDLRIAQEGISQHGWRSAYFRAAHFLCEMRTRLTEVGMAESFDCVFPLTPSDLAKTVVRSVVQTKHVLHQLRRNSLFRLAKGWLEFHVRVGLATAGGFDGGHLETGMRG